MNESIYYNIDGIHGAISQGSQITFHYFEWTPDKEKRLRHDGKLYHVSPWALSWDDENYYLVASDSQVGEIRHYRVDKMQHITATGEKREGHEWFKKFDMALYSKKMFGMFRGKEEMVKLRFTNHLAGVVIDRFGEETPITRCDEEHFIALIHVCVSPQFFSWLFGFGNEVEILSPTEVAQQYALQLKKTLSLYP